MRSFWTDRRLLAISTCLFVFAVQPAFAQRGSSGAGAAASAATGSVGRGTSTTTTGNSGIGNTSTGSSTTLSRPIFLSGKVMFDDGTQPNTEIKIERVCSGASRLEAHTDSKGRFSFQMGQEPSAFEDASESASPGFGASNNGLGNGMGTTSMSSPSRMSSSDPLWNCELRAAYPGFRSDIIDLSTRRSLDDPDIGTIILHRLGNVQGSTISLTTALAPKRAQKDYEKGLEAGQKGKLDEAEKDFTQATTLYPKYAIAWFALGQLEEHTGKPELARAAYIKASEADSKYVSPYDRLAYLSAQQNKWPDAADYSAHAIELNPVEFPSSFWYNAIANFQMHKEAEAEKSVTELLKLDTRHNYPDAESMMAQILWDEGKYPEAATHLRTYLALVPNAKNADALKAMLLKIDQASAKAKPQTPPQ